MKTITLKNFPEELLKKLKELAKANNRSLNSEIIHILKVTSNEDRFSRADIMERARKIRDSIQVKLSQSEMSRAKNEGRL
jgi:plasmid stability protein